MSIRRPRSALPYAPPEDPLREAARSRERVPRLAIESLLIVLSVLLGFAANQWHDRRAERALAAQALSGFRRELNENLEMLQRVQPKHLEMSNRLKMAASAPKPGQTAFEAFAAAMPEGGLSIPPLSDAAWETATSSGALRLIGYDRAAYLSVAYHAQTTMNTSIGQRIEERLTSPENFDPQRREQMLRAESLLFSEISGVEIYVIGVYRQTIKSLDERGGR